MNRLKGNYKLSKGKEKPVTDSPKIENSTNEFQKRALERLGGSISFIQKKDVFVWDGETSVKKQKGK